MPPSGGYFFWRRWKEDLNPSKCKAPVELCSFPARRERHHTFCEAEWQSNPSISAPKKRQRLMQANTVQLTMSLRTSPQDGVAIRIPFAWGTDSYVSVRTGSE